MKIRIPSFSAIDKFSRCPREYAFELVYGRSPPSVAMKRGTHLHDGLENAAKLVLSKQHEWQRALLASSAMKGEMSQDEYASYLERALPIVKELVPVKGGIEAWFDSVGEPWGFSPLPICGKIDLISETSWFTTEQAYVHEVIEGPAVIDYKTISREEKIKTSWETHRSMQLKIYCLTTGLKHAGFIYFPPKTEARAMFVQYTEEDMRVAYNWLTRQLDAMLACWNTFFEYFPHPHTTGYSWGDEVDDKLALQGDWQAFPLCHPDNFLCSKKWCDHFDKCIGAQSAERIA